MRYTVAKSVSNLVSLRSYLLNNGYETMALLNSVDTVWIDVPDEAADPTTLILDFVEPPTISATSNKPMGPFRHYQGVADGVDAQTVTVQMLNPDGSNNTTWNGAVLAQPLSPITVVSTTVNITNGVGTFVVGPTTMPGEYDFYMQIQGDTIGYSFYRLHLSFF